MIVRFEGAESGFVLAGRSLREIEKRETQVELEAGLALTATLEASPVVVGLCEIFLSDRRTGARMSLRQAIWGGAQKPRLVQGKHRGCESGTAPGSARESASRGRALAPAGVLEMGACGAGQRAAAGEAGRVSGECAGAG